MEGYLKNMENGKFDARGIDSNDDEDFDTSNVDVHTLLETLNLFADAYNKRLVVAPKRTLGKTFAKLAESQDVKGLDKFKEIINKYNSSQDFVYSVIDAAQPYFKKMDGVNYVSQALDYLKFKIHPNNIDLEEVGSRPAYQAVFNNLKKFKDKSLTTRVFEDVVNSFRESVKNNDFKTLYNLKDRLASEPYKIPINFSDVAFVADATTKEEKYSEFVQKFIPKNYQ